MSLGVRFLFILVGFFLFVFLTNPNALWVGGVTQWAKDTIIEQGKQKWSKTSDQFTEKARLTLLPWREGSSVILGHPCQSPCMAWREMKASADSWRYNYLKGGGVIKVRIIYLEEDKN